MGFEPGSIHDGLNGTRNTVDANGLLSEIKWEPRTIFVAGFALTTAFLYSADNYYDKHHSHPPADNPHEITLEIK